MNDSYIALIRGVNVGGHNKLNMADLRAICETLHWQKVSTYINSGNVVFKTVKSDAKALGSSLSAAIKSATGLAVGVIVVSLSELEAVYAYDPFSGSDAALKNEGYILFLEDIPAPGDVAALSFHIFIPEVFIIHGKAIYLLYPDGSGHSKMTTAFFERKLHMLATSRNRKTLLKLIEMAKSME
ncbi:MAG: DUF1697 domain-containing protein [Candidatus Cloacimonadaceae bacterium]|nr:DUF1697 domain-containing protein [Candidatus Cloacimonadaceae bacterium]